MDPRTVYHLARKEIGDSLRNRWFLLYSLAFLVLTLALSYVSLAGSGMFGYAGFGRTTAGLVNLVLLVVPLMGLTLGSGSLAGERERGTLDYLLAQPVNRAEVFLGKYLGLATAMLCSLAVGFGVSAAAIAAMAGTANPGGFALLVGLTFILALVMLGLGFCISSLARKATVATGAAIFVWLSLVFLSDLGLIGGTMAFRLEVAQLFRLALLNPLQVFKMAVLGGIHATLDLLGPVGIYADQTYGDSLPLIFGGSLALWTILPLVTALILFATRPRL
jgi:Cu-processing system permease protein